MVGSIVDVCVQFQSTLPTRGSDGELIMSDAIKDYNFNPRSPRGGATFRWLRLNQWVSLFQSTLPTRGSDLAFMRPICGTAISIHAPHEGERQDWTLLAEQTTTISIHAPHEGERLLDPDWPGWDDVFQSTLPTRGSDTGIMPIMTLV